MSRVLKALALSPVISSLALAATMQFADAASRMTQPKIVEENGKTYVTAILDLDDVKCEVINRGRGYYEHTGKGTVQRHPGFSVVADDPIAKKFGLNKEPAAPSVEAACAAVMLSFYEEALLNDQKSFDKMAPEIAKKRFGTADVLASMVQDIPFAPARTKMDGSRVAIASDPAKHFMAELTQQPNGNTTYMIKDTLSGGYGVLALDADGFFAVTLSDDTRAGHRFNYTQNQRSVDADSKATLSYHSNDGTQNSTAPVANMLSSETMARLRQHAEMTRARNLGPALGAKGSSQSLTPKQ